MNFFEVNRHRNKENKTINMLCILLFTLFTLFDGQVSGQGHDSRIVFTEDINHLVSNYTQLIPNSIDIIEQAVTERQPAGIYMSLADGSAGYTHAENTEPGHTHIASDLDSLTGYSNQPYLSYTSLDSQPGTTHTVFLEPNLLLAAKSIQSFTDTQNVNGYIFDLTTQSGAPVAYEAEFNNGFGTISGQVTDASTGETLPGANVVVKGTTVGVATDVDGRYTLRRVPAGELILEIRYIGYISQEIDVNLSDGERLSINIALVGDFIEGDAVFVTALQRGQSRALTMQRQSVNIRAVVSAEQIERFADVTVEGALQRIAGMGHGGTNIRGIGAGAANVTMDGQRMGSTGSDRSVELETISVDMVQDLEVIKVITPDMNADALSGTININTRRPIGGQRTMNVRADGGWNSRFLNFAGPNGRVSISYGDSPNEFFSYGVNLSYLRDTPSSESVSLDWGIENFEQIEGQSDVLNGLRNKISFDPRNRYSAGLQFTVQPTKRSTYHFVTNLNYQQKAQEAHEMNWSWSNLISPFETFQVGTPGGSGSVSYTASLDDREIYQFTTRMGARHLFDKFDMEYNLGWGHGRTNAYDFSSSFFMANKFEFLINLDRGTDYPLIDIGLLSTEKELSPFQMSYQGWAGSDRGDKVDRSFHINNDFTGNIDFDVPYRKGSFKFGASAIMGFSNGMSEQFVLVDESKNNKRLVNFDMRLQRDFNIFDRPHETYQIPYIVDVRSLKDRSKIYRHHFTMDPLIWAESAETSYFNAHEFTYAAYGMGRLNINRFRLLGGLRVENTHTKYLGRAGRINSVGRFAGAVDTLNTSSYINYFPNAQVVLSLGNFTQIRAAYSRSIGRPSLDQLSPYVLWNYNTRRIRQGNPFLRPMLSNNLDLQFEHYFLNVGQFTVGIFYKAMKDFIYQYTERFGADGVDGNGTFALWHRTTMLNGQEATVYGLELSWQQNLDFLPGFLRNIGVYANYSYAYSVADVNRPGETVRLIGQRPHVINSGLDYTQGNFSGQISYAWGAPSIASYGDLDFAPSIYGDSKRVYIDNYRAAANDLSMTVRYRLTSSFRLWAAASNIMNQRSVNYAYNKEVYPNTITLSGRTISVGLQYSY
jgi:TonB-dependent receptor